MPRIQLPASFLLLHLILAVGVIATASAAEKDPNSPRNRRYCIDPVEQGQMRVEAQFRTASVVYGAPKDAAPVFEYRLKGTDEWRQPSTPPFFAAEYDNWRTMLLNLAEDAEYEVRVVSGSWLVISDSNVQRTRTSVVPVNQPPITNHQPLATKTFRTMASEVPIAKTIYLDPKDCTKPFVINDQGKPDGWIRYTIRPGEKLVNTAGGESFIRVEKARYVVLDNLCIEGGPVQRAVQLCYSSDVRVRNCDISKWGPKPLDKPFVDYRYFLATGEVFEDGLRKPKGSIWSSGVHVHFNCTRCVVERCYIHDPVVNSVAWRYYHPGSVEGITLGRKDCQTVIRYNDIVGSDLHRWDDAIVSNGNFTPDGGPGRSAEIYGNFCSLPNDDCIELDGEQQCVACFCNRFEGGLVGISLQGNMASPSYVFQNLICGQGDYFGECGQCIKTSSFDYAGLGPYSAVFRNVLWGLGGTGINIATTPPPADKVILPGLRGRIDVIENVFCQGRQINGIGYNPEAIVTGNVFEAGSDLKWLNPNSPYRPLSFTLDAVRFDVGRDRSPRVFRIRGGKGERFSVVRPGGMDWFDVEPKEGAARDGMELTIRFRDEKMHDAPAYRGAVLLRTEDGFSRAVTVYATAEWSQPERCEQPGDVAVYRKPSDAAVDKKGYSVWRFTAPKKGRYYLMGYAQADRRPDVLLAVNGETAGYSVLQTCPDYPVWGIFSNRGATRPGRMMWGGRVTWYDLEAGEEVRLRLKPYKGAYDLRSLVLTDNPIAFEPKIARCEGEGVKR